MHHRPNVDLMLDEMDAPHLAEWMAFFQVKEEERKRAELAAKAEAGLQDYRRRR